VRRNLLSTGRKRGEGKGQKRSEISLLKQFSERQKEGQRKGEKGEIGKRRKEKKTKRRK